MSLSETKGSVRFEINAKKLNTFFWQKARTYRHFKNIYLIHREALYKNQLEGEDFVAPPFKISEDVDARQLYRAFINPDVIRAVVKNRKGGRIANQVALINSALASVEMFQQLKDVAEDLQAKTIHKELKKINAGFKSFYTKIQQGDPDARPPKAKKLSRVYEQTVAIDQDCLSFKRKNTVRVNINGGMVDLPLRHDTILKVVKDFSRVQSAEIICSNDRLTLVLLYNRLPVLDAEPIEYGTVFAGLDLGIKNIASIAIDDEDSRSILVNGDRLIEFNANNNRLLGKYKSEKDLLTNQAVENDKVFYKKLSELNNRISKLYAKRRKFYFDQFHKLSLRLLEDLRERDVGTLFVSRNLGDCKNTKGKSMGKKNNQKFYQIPLLKLLDKILLKAGAFGIEIIEIDEAYSSRCSALSGDIVEVQRLREEENEKMIGAKDARSQRTKALNGRRVRRSLFKDTVHKVSYHADLNAAYNHIRIGLGAARNSHSYLLKKMWKLTNPIRIDLKTNALNCYLDRPRLRPG